METKKFEVVTDSGEHYGWVEIPLQALQNGWKQPRYVHVDGVICEGDRHGRFIRKEAKEGATE